MSTTALHSMLNISEIVRDKRLGSKSPPIGDGIWGIKWSCGFSHNVCVVLLFKFAVSCAKRQNTTKTTGWPNKNRTFLRYQKNHIIRVVKSLLALMFTRYHILTSLQRIFNTRL